MSAETELSQEQAADPERQKLIQKERERRLNPSACALIVVDLQNDYMHEDGFIAKTLGKPVDKMQSTLPYIQGLVDRAHVAGVQVVYTQTYEDVALRDPDGPDFLRAVEWGEDDQDPSSICAKKGTWGAEFYPGVEPQEGDIVVEKSNFNALSGLDKNELDPAKKKDLYTILKEKGILGLVIAGVITETCIETTVRTAYSMGFSPFVPEHSVQSDDQEQQKANTGYYSTGFLGGRLLDEEDIKAFWPVKTPEAESPQVES